MARAGLCSRRDAEAWIEAGRVAVNGTVLESPARDVTPADKVTVDGQPIPTRERTRLFLFHKPRGTVTTARDPEGRQTVFEALPAGLPRVVTVGRLDINTEGLLLLTNDGGLKRVLELPDTGWLRRYRVRAYGEITQADLDGLRDGITIDDMNYGPIEALLDRGQGDNVWITLGLREGKNREVKRILEHLGLQVNRLIRVSYGPFQLGDLAEGAVEEIKTRVLADQLGEALARQASVDFDAPSFVYDEEPEPAPEPRGRGDRSERPARGARPARDEERPTRSPRFVRDGAPDPTERPRPPRRHPTEPLRSVWRAEDPGAVPHRKIPRRGLDAKQLRAEGGEKPHERTGRVKDRKGRAVLVERVSRPPAEEPVREARAPEDDRPKRNLWAQDDARPARSRAGGPGPRRDDRPGGRSKPAGFRTGGPSREEGEGRRPGGDRPAGGAGRGPRSPSKGPGGPFKGPGRGGPGGPRKPRPS